jgi:hypothetical protein
VKASSQYSTGNAELATKEHGDTMSLTGSSLAHELNGVLDHFHAPIRYAFAYGSGALRQDGYTHADIRDKVKFKIDALIHATWSFLTEALDVNVDLACY